MSKRMTVVFHDEGLYICLKVEAAKRNKPASDIVVEALREWLGSHEDGDLLREIEAARSEWRRKGGCSWAEVERELEGVMGRREREAGFRSV